MTIQNPKTLYQQIKYFVRTQTTCEPPRARHLTAVVQNRLADIARSPGQ
jgi:hypothetical protein